MSSYAMIVPALVAAAAIALLLASPLASKLVDRPGERSLHSRDTPRFGGIGLMLGALPFVFLQGPAELRLIAAAAAGLAVVSLVDDLRTLPVAVRLPCHFAAAAVAVAAATAAPTPAELALAFVALLGIAWAANLYNFMDGADGLAGGMTAIGFATLGIAAFRAGDAATGNACVAIAAAAVGFLAFNFPPARVFMGDAGSVPLGFLAGATGWLGATRGLWPAWFPLLVFSPFVLDATVTLARRALAGEPLLRAHRSHYYQRLVLGGWTHRRLAAWEWGAMALASVAGLFALGQPAAVQAAILSVWAIACGGAMAYVDRRHPRHPGGRRPQPPGTGR